METQNLQPDNGNSPIPENFYAVRFVPNDLVNTGTGLFLPFALDPRQIITNVGVYLIDPIDDSGGGLTAAQISIGARQGGAPLIVATIADISTNTATIGQMYFGITPPVTIAVTSNGYVNGVNYGTLTDSVLGACTPQAVTTNTTLAAVSSINSSTANMPPQTTDFTGATARTTEVLITLTGNVFANITNGDFYVYFWTKTLPNYMVN